jgi:hypothetical protein
MPFATTEALRTTGWIYVPDRLAFITSFDGPWDAYMEDFFTSGPTLALFDVIFRHVEGYEGLPDLAAVRGSSWARRSPRLPTHGTLQGNRRCPHGFVAGSGISLRRRGDARHP